MTRKKRTISDRTSLNRSTVSTIIGGKKSPKSGNRKKAGYMIELNVLQSLDLFHSQAVADATRNGVIPLQKSVLVQYAIAETLRRLEQRELSIEDINNYQMERGL